MAANGYRGPAFDSSELRELKAKVVNGCLILDREGITDGFGHVSVRIPEQAAFLTIAQVSPGCAALDKLGARSRSEAEPERSSPGIAPKPIEPVDVDKAASRLAPFVGPIAKVMAKKAAAQGGDLRILYQRLAENLADPKERTEFLRKAGYGD